MGHPPAVRDDIPGGVLYESCLLYTSFMSACGDGQDLILQEEFRTQEYLPDYDVQMQYQPDTATGICRIGDTYYFSCYPSTYFYFYEIEEGTGGKLCAKPECTHDTKDCNAYIGDLASPSGYYGGTLQAYDRCV